MTKRDAFVAVINGEITDEVIEVMEKELASLDKRSAREAEKRAEKAKADEPIVNAIKDALKTDTYKSATEIAEIVGNNVTTSKVSAVLRKVDWVKVLDGREIGDGKPGKIFPKLLKEFKALTRSTGEPIKRKK